MLPRELMIYDWVYDNENECYWQHNIKDYRCENRILLSFEPIPITDDILKENGFVREGGTSWNIEYHVNVQHWSKDNMVLNGTGKHGNPINIPDIVYVHELQNALRLCGLTELADNFVIEKGNNNG